MGLVNLNSTSKNLVSHSLCVCEYVLNLKYSCRLGWEGVNQTDSSSFYPHGGGFAERRSSCMEQSHSGALSCHLSIRSIVRHHQSY